MENQELDAQEKLLKVAAAIFYEKGFHGARMQEIADRAGLNKAMLHYYFHSKEQLFDAVFEQALQRLLPSVVRFFAGEEALRAKASRLIDEYTTLLQEEPQVPIFILSELRMRPDKLATLGKNLSLETERLKAQIEAEVAQGRLQLVDPWQMVITLFSACIFPYISGPIWQGLLNLDVTEYGRLLNGRKQALLDLFWREQ